MQTRSLQEAFERLEGAERQVDDMGRRLDNLTRHLDGLMRILTIVDPRQGSPHHTRQVAPNSGLSMTYPEPASAPGTDGSTFHDVDQSEFLSDQPMTTSVPPILDAGSVEQLRLELPASGYDQVIAIEEMTELGTALSEDNIPFPDFDHVIFNQHQITHPRNGSWYLRKTAIEELLLPVDQPMGEIEPCFCGGVYATATATGDCHAPAKMPVCGHIFGRSCIATWLQSKNSCPMCRDKVVLPRIYRNQEPDISA